LPTVRTSYALPALQIQALCALVRAANIALAVLAGILLLYAWKRAYWSMGSRFIFPALIAHYEAARYGDGNVVVDIWIVNTVFATAGISRPPFSRASPGY
jgi:hypothetical protein